MKAQNMRRREFLKAVGIGAAAAVMSRRACAAARAAGKDRPRPNIVWISAEDISPTVGCYGDKYATTPNLDKFASQGVRYDAAFAHAPVCAPARSGIITGMYPTRIGTTWMRCRGVPPVEARCFPEYLRAAGYYCTNSSKTDYQFAPPRSAWDESSGGAHFRKRRQKDQPFFAVFNFTVSHESSTRRWTPGKQEHDPAKAPLPPYYPDTPIVRQNIACYYDKMSQLDSQIRRVLDELEADGLAENTIVWFWGDHGWGLTRGKRWIYDSGLRVPLMVRVPTGLRAWAGAGDAKALAPGRAEKELVSFIDFAPTVLSLAGVPIPPHMQGQAFLGPQKAARPREYIFGARDRMDETYDCIRCLRDKRFKYIRNFMPYVTRGQHIAYMDRTPILQEMRRLHAAGELKPGPQMQYFEPTKPVHELYDTVADPHEVNNLAGEAKYRDVLERMNKALKQFMLDIGDVGLIPEPDFDAMKGGGATAAPAFSVAPAGEGKAATVTISCPTPGASITYQVVKAAPAGPAGTTGAVGPAGENIASGGKGRKGAKRVARGEGGDQQWLLYSRPVELAPGQGIRAQAWRLGYTPSTVATYRYGEKPAAPTKVADTGPMWREKLDKSDLLARLLAIKEFDGRCAEGVPTFLKALSDKDGAMRYWAVVGLHLGCQDAKSIAKATAAVEPLLEDPSPSVKVAAANAMRDWREGKKGTPSSSPRAKQKR